MRLLVLFGYYSPKSPLNTLPIEIIAYICKYIPKSITDYYLKKFYLSKEEIRDVLYYQGNIFIMYNFSIKKINLKSKEESNYISKEELIGNLVIYNNMLATLIIDCAALDSIFVKILFIERIYNRCYFSK